MVSNVLFSVKVMGAFDLLDQNGISVRPSGRKDCAIIAILALTRNHRQTRTWLQDKLWSDRGPAQGAASLRQALTTLRGILNLHEEILCADRTWVWLDAEKLNFDHVEPEPQDEVLRGFDLKDEGFNEWLRETRKIFEARQFSHADEAGFREVDRRWHLDVVRPGGTNEDTSAIGDLLCDGLAEALCVVGVSSMIDRRVSPMATKPHATDFVVSIRTLQIGSGLLVSVTVTDGFGSLCWQIRRDVERVLWAELRFLQEECVQLFQDFVIRIEAARLHGARWSAHANGCQALLGTLVPGSMPVRDITRCSEAAIAADERGIYHALLGWSYIRQFGERETLATLDADVVMQNFRTALKLDPTNGLVQALSGHTYGFFVGEIERNAEMTREAVRLLPGSGVCWNFYAISLTYAGKFREAVKAACNATTLCKGTLMEPRAQSTELYARLMAGDTAEAIRIGEKSVDAFAFRPSLLDLMTAYAFEGKIQEGRDKLAILTHREPDLSIDMLKSPEYPIVNSAHREAVTDAAGRLGLH